MLSLASSFHRAHWSACGVLHMDLEHEIEIRTLSETNLDSAFFVENLKLLSLMMPVNQSSYCTRPHRFRLWPVRCNRTLMRRCFCRSQPQSGEIWPLARISRLIWCITSLASKSAIEWSWIIGFPKGSRQVLAMCLNHKGLLFVDIKPEDYHVILRRRTTLQFRPLVWNVIQAAIILAFDVGNLK